MATENPPAVSQRFGRYTLFGELAAGGMATVHLGRVTGALGFSRIIAVKRIHTHYARDNEFVTLFLDEIRLTSRVQHPNIVSTLDAVAEGSHLLLVMEYIHGDTLARLLAGSITNKEPIPLRIVGSIICGILHGLHAAHEATDEQGAPLQIVHRDVSPHNLIVGADGVARLLDFGVAQAANRLHVTRTGQLLGKPAYMAPEQLRGEDIDRRTDVYSAAVVLWETLTQRRLVTANDPWRIARQVVSGPPHPPPSIHVPSLPAAIDAVVSRGLAQEPSDRYDTALAMALALETALGTAGLASQHEVGEWVERTSDRLAERAQLVRDLETPAALPPTDALTPLLPVGTSVTLRAIPSRSDSTPATATYLTEADETRSAFFPVRPPSQSAPGFGSMSSEPSKAVLLRKAASPWRWILAIGAILGGAGLMTSYVILRRPPSFPSPADTSSASLSRPSASSLVALPSPSPSSLTIAAEVLSATAADSRESVPTGKPPPPLHPVASARSETVVRSLKRSGNHEAESTTAVDPCDPPYTLDASGFRRVKPACR